MTRRVLKGFCVGLLLAACQSAIADDKFYRWTDENGTVHYSQTPPPSQPVQQVDVQSASPPKVTEPAAAEVAVEALAEPADETLKKMLAMEADLCARARASLQLLEDGRSITTYSAKGGPPQPVVGAERETAKIQARAQVVQFCAPPAVAKGEG